jgi:flavorubredoxin/flavin reductase (DIM6/NTAB) family NADH-FMN oxidoreductase RutF
VATAAAAAVFARKWSRAEKIAKRARRAKSGVTRRALALVGEPTVSEVTEMPWDTLTPGKIYKIQTMCQEIAENTRTIRSLDGERDRFDIEFALTNGTTYNAYTIDGGEKSVLIDTSHLKFDKQFMEALESPTGGAVDLATLDYLVCTHTEPDHSGLVPHVLEAAKAKGNDKLTIVGSKICINFLQQLMNDKSFKSKVVKPGEKIDLGGGHELEFVLAPNLHWPDTMLVYDHKTHLLFTCDFFGAHYSSNTVLDVEPMKDLLPHYKLYYDCLMRPNARSVLTGIKKIKELDGPVEAICVSHGPVMQNNLEELIGLYESWSKEASKKLGPSILLFWVSRHGESERLAQSFAYGATSAEVSVEMQDLNACDAFEVVEAMSRNQVIVVMTPPRGESTETAQVALSTIIANASPKDHRFAICASGGEKDEPIDAVVSRFVGSGIEGIDLDDADGEQPWLRFEPDLSDAKNLAIYEETGRKLAATLLAPKKKAAMDKLNDAMMAALGKVSNGRYIVTASRAGVSNAVPATWVMPASTEPATVAFAVPKDKALESLVQRGDTFVVNLLEEGKHLDVLKHFQQDFRVGADVFAGVDTFEVQTPQKGNGIVLKEACAYVACQTVSRMEAGDHIIVNGVVVAGEGEADARVAQSHRKSAAYY